MQNPIKTQQTTTKAILVGIAVMVIGTTILYFLRFFGFSMRAILMKSISQASNSELYANIILIFTICLFGLSAFVLSLLIWGKDYDDILRKKLGAFLIDEIERLKNERQKLIKMPPPPVTPLSHLEKESRFLSGQEEILFRLSRWLKPPKS